MLSPNGAERTPEDRVRAANGKPDASGCINRQARHGASVLAFYNTCAHVDALISALGCIVGGRGAGMGDRIAG